MAALTPTVVKRTEYAGDIKTKVFTVTPGAASDSVALANYFDTIYSVVGVLEGGADANLSAALQISFSGTTVTIVQKNAAGSDATDWTSATIRLIVVGSDNGVAG